MVWAPTTFSRLSTGYKNSATTMGEAVPDLDFIDGQGDTLTLANSLTVGGGTSLEAISLVTVSADFGSVTSLQPDSTITVAVSGAVDGDLLYAMKPSLWSGTQSQLQINATSGDTTGEVNLTCHNSGITSIDPAAAVVNILHINF